MLGHALRPPQELKNEDTSASFLLPLGLCDKEACCAVLFSSAFWLDADKEEY